MHTCAAYQEAQGLLQFVSSHLSSECWQCMGHAVLIRHLIGTLPLPLPLPHCPTLPPYSPYLVSSPAVDVNQLEFHSKNMSAVMRVYQRLSRYFQQDLLNNMLYHKLLSVYFTCSSFQIFSAVIENASPYLCKFCPKCLFYFQ